MKVPFISVSLQSSQLNFGFLPRTTLVIVALPLLPSFIVTVSPAFNWKEGTFTTSPFTAICLWLTSWRAAGRLGAIPIRKTVLSRRASSNLIRFSPVTPLRRAASSNVLRNCFSRMPYVYFAFCFSRSCRAYSPNVLRFFLSPCIPGGLLFLSSHLPLPKIGSPKRREILGFGPVYLAIVCIHFDFF